MPLSGNQVHIAPLGVEKERITKPIIDEGADHVILLEYIPPVAYSKELRTEIEAELEAESINYERKHANLEDLFDALNAFGEVIRDRADAGDDVYVNISSGNKIGAAGGLMACMEYQSATPYYVQAEAGTSMVADDRQMAENVTGWDSIPLYPLERPDEDMLRMMKFIADADTELRDQNEPFRIKKDLIEFAEENELSFIQGCEGGSQAKHNLLRRHIIEPLAEKWGFLQTNSVGTTDRVMLTQDGKNTVQGFEYLIE